MTRLTLMCFASACILFAVFTAPTHAQTLLELEAAAALDAIVQPDPKPLEAIKKRAEEIRDNAFNARTELKTDARAEFKSATSSEERKDVVRDFVSDRVDIAKTRAASTSALKRNVKAAISWHGGLIRERFAVAIRQFERIVERIESRLEKLEAGGVATEVVETELDEAKSAIETAKVDAKAVADFVGSVDEASDRAAVKAELEAKLRAAHASIKSAHAALKEAARALTALNNEVKVNATTTVSTSDD